MAIAASGSLENFRPSSLLVDGVGGAWACMPFFGCACGQGGVQKSTKEKMMIDEQNPFVFRKENFELFDTEILIITIR